MAGATDGDPAARITRVFGAVNIEVLPRFRDDHGQAEDGEMIVLEFEPPGERRDQAGYVTDMRTASHAIRTAVEKAEANANTSIQSVWIGCAGAGLSSRISSVEIAIGGRRIEEDDIEHLLYAARDHLHPDGRMVLHAQPAHYTLDGAHGVANPQGLHAEALGVDVHVTLAEGAPVRNLIEAVQTAHLDVEGVVASPLAAAHACLTGEERDLGVALVEIGAQVTNVSVHAAGMLLGLKSIPIGSNDITDAIAILARHSPQPGRTLRAFRARRSLRRPITRDDPGRWPGRRTGRTLARGADEHNRIRACRTGRDRDRSPGHRQRRDRKALKRRSTSVAQGGQVVLTGGEPNCTARSPISCRARSAGRCGSASRPSCRASPKRTRRGFATLAGLCLYAADDPVDIRSVGPRYQPTKRYQGMGLVNRVFKRCASISDG